MLIDLSSIIFYEFHKFSTYFHLYVNQKTSSSMTSRQNSWHNFTFYFKSSYILLRYPDNKLVDGNNPLIRRHLSLSSIIVFLLMSISFSNAKRVCWKSNRNENNRYLYYTKSQISIKIWKVIITLATIFSFHFAKQECMDKFKYASFKISISSEQ